MNISEKRKSELYDAIHEPIMKKRITIAQSEDVLGKKSAKDIDSMMFRLELEIWKSVKKVLKIGEE